MNKPDGFNDTFKPQREDHVYNAVPQREDHTFDDNKPQREDHVYNAEPQRDDTLPDDSKTQRDDNFVVEDKPQADDKPVANDIFDDDFYRMVNSTIKSNSSSTSQPKEPVKPPVSNYSTPKTTVPPPKKSNNKGKIILVLFVLATILTAVFLLKQYNTTDLPLISDPTTTVTDSPLVENTTEYTDDIISEEETEEKTEYNSEVFVEEETEYTIAAEVFVGYNTVDFDSYGTLHCYFTPPESGYYVFKSENEEDLNATLDVYGQSFYEDDNSGDGNNFLVVASLIGGYTVSLDISPVSGAYVSEINIRIEQVDEIYATGVELFKYYKENGIYIDNKQSMYNYSPDYSQETSNWTNSGTKYPVSFLIKDDVLWLSFDTNHDTQGDITIWYPTVLTDKTITAYKKFLDYKDNGIYIDNEQSMYNHSPDYSQETSNWTNSGTKYPVSFLIKDDVLWLSFDTNHDTQGDIAIWYPIKLS